MKISIFPTLLALASGVVTPSFTPPRGDIEPEPLVAPAEAADTIEPAAALVEPIRELTVSTRLAPIAAPAPADVKVDVRRDGKGGARITVNRKGFVITLRRGSERVVAAEQASLPLLRGDAAATQMIWETTALATLVTTRGLVVLDEASAQGGPGPRAGRLPSAKLRLGAAPVLRAVDSGLLHACVAQDDGLGAFTVLCRVDAMPSATSLTGASNRESIAVVPGEPSLVRVDLAAAESGVAAAVVGYTDGLSGVVIRAEASRLAGEDHPVVTVVSASRQQPFPPPRPRRYVCDEFF
jgi:hypothetical protein